MQGAPLVAGLLRVRTEPHQAKAWWGFLLSLDDVLTLISRLYGKLLRTQPAPD